MKYTDNFLNSITIYKTVLFGLLFLVLCAVSLSFFNILPYKPYELIISLLVFVVSCFLSNLLLAKIFKVPANSESYLITALILFFIVSPPSSGQTALSLILVGVVAMASKYILNINKKHIFNPAAIAVFLVAFTKLTGASWWVADPVLFIPTLIVGILAIRKLRRFPMFFAFFITASLVMLFHERANLSLETLYFSFTAWPIIFLGTIMLTEPLTAPPTKKLQIVYGVIVGSIFSARFSIGPIIASPELALIIGNLFSYFVSFKERITLVLKDKQKLSASLYNFSFLPRKEFKFKAGQYLEWTLDHKNTDIRGNRRFFTIASAPTEPEVMLGARIEEKSSSFKKALLSMKDGQILIAGSLAGDFTLPDNTNEKLVFIAGGIGITPFRSMIKYLIDKNERRDIVLFHVCSRGDDFIYGDVFEKAENIFGIRKIDIINNRENTPKNFKGEVGHVSIDLLKKYVSDYQNRKYFISGSNLLVENIKKDLKTTGITGSQIVTDYFPGY